MTRNWLTRNLLRVIAATAFLVASTGPAAAQRPLRIFISVDMEGIGGIGTPAMTNANGKDYALGRKLMTDEVNAVVAAIFQRGPAEVLVNDSHGDMQNLLHAELDPRVTYIQGAVKPYGMVEGLDSTFDGAIFVGYHARAGTPSGFLAHTGTGSVKGLWLNGVEAGEGDLNAAYAASFGVPVLVASGDSAFVEQFTRFVRAHGVTTKHAMTPLSARLIHPQVVRERLAAATRRALDARPAKPTPIGTPVRVRLRLADITVPQILQAIPGVKQVDGYTVEFTAPTMADAYRLIRLMYRFVSI
ncbi:MAG TPA: M55 family metallopeptidase [Gemmatimonadaceae bacterium]|nr:M55 family metallopeptidase [Gemmatimonadaceae bacterium]